MNVWDIFFFISLFPLPSFSESTMVHVLECPHALEVYLGFRFAPTE